jgi:hypothetical protein
MSSERIPDDDRPVDESDEALGADDPEDDAPGADDDLVQYEAFETQNRLWIKAIVPVLQLRMAEAPRNGRVQFALDRLQVAACERLTRILSSDLPAVDD